MASGAWRRRAKRGRGSTTHGGHVSDRTLKLPGGKGAAADGGPDDDPRTHEHQVLDDVLAFEGGGIRELRKDLAREQEERCGRADHLEGQKQQRQADKLAGDQTKPYGALKECEQHEAYTGRQQAEGEHIYGLDREGLGRAKAG